MAWSEVNARLFHSDDLHVLRAISNYPLISLIIVDLPVILFDVLAMIIECFINSPGGATKIMVIDRTMVRRLLAIVRSSIVSATIIDIEVVGTGGTDRHSRGVGRSRSTSIKSEHEVFLHGNTPPTSCYDLSLRLLSARGGRVSSVSSEQQKRPCKHTADAVPPEDSGTSTPMICFRKVMYIMISIG